MKEKKGNKKASPALRRHGGRRTWQKGGEGKLTPAGKNGIAFSSSSSGREM